ncbi:MAG: zinc ribbon domain-containing protein [Nitrospirae bacterium]|nr:zinc ribbon domain-containing protein [Nitrospirota bacterium]
MPHSKDSKAAGPDNSKKAARKEYICPYCNKKMNKWQVPPFNFSDGLGWCSDHLYICFNDECGFFKRSWDHMDEQFGHSMGYRAMIHPDSNECMAVPVGSVDAMKGNILDEIQEAKDEASLELRRLAMARLTDAFIARDTGPIMEILRSSEEWPSVRLKAAQMLGDIGDPKSLDALHAVEPGHDAIGKAIADAIKKIHETHFTKECPYCAEVIKARAVVCKHCGKELG